MSGTGGSTERWERIWSLFEGAIQRPEPERSRWLDDECRGDQELHHEVERLIAGHEEGVALEKSLPDIAPDFWLEGDESRAGCRFGPYEIVQEIGRGGMGVVYRARDPRLDRFVALKVLPSLLRTDEGARARLLSEARAASTLDHPNICTVFDLGETEDGGLFIAMACYEGETLQQKLARGPLSVEESVGLAIQIARGLACAHEAGIVHRDIKPSNLIVTLQGSVKILDFGIAKLSSDPALTLPGSRVGTAAYMSPEQAAGEMVDPRADLWSLGVVLYECLTGQLPFRGDNELAVLNALATRKPPPIREHRPDVPESIEALVDRALAKRPDERFQSAGEIVAVLEDIKAGGPVRPASRAQLPVRLTSFVGREDDQARVQALLSEVRLLTLTGPAGTGKTRLALEVAEELSGRFRDGAFVVLLSDLDDAALVASAIVHSMGIVETRRADPLELLKDYLRPRQILLVLDNFEHVSDAAPVVAELLALCPSLKILVTSRVPLRLTGEQEFPVPPLGLPREDDPDLAGVEKYSAIRLFVDRARAANPRFTLTRGNARAVADICSRLDGLPLAIEIAAARVKLFSPESMRGRLERRLDLRSDQRDRPERHQTLRNAIGWSYELLDEGERAFMRRLSVFIGGFTMEAAERVASAAGSAGLDSFQGIETLVSQSLLQVLEEEAGRSWFSQLGTIREFGRDRLREAGEEETTLRAHAEYFADLAERAERELTGPEQLSWLDRLEREHANLRAALSWSERHAPELGLRLGAALWRFWVVRGHMEEGRERLKGLLASAATEQDPRRFRSLKARVLNGLGTITLNQGDSLAARSMFQESVALFRDEKDDHGAAAALTHLAWVACELSDFEGGRVLSNEALELNQKLGETRGVALALNNLGWIANYQADYRGARKYHERSLDLRRRIGDRRGIAFALTNLAWAERYHGDLSQAEMLLREARAILDEVRDESLLGWALFHQGYVAQERGELEEAARFWGRTAALYRQGSNRFLLALASTALAALLGDIGARDRAQTLLEESLPEWEELNMPWGRAWALFEVGRIAHASGNRNDALARYRDSLALERELGDRRVITDNLEAIGELERDGYPEKTARLLAASGAIRKQAEIARPLRLVGAYERCRRELREQLGDAVLERLSREGEGLDLESAIALALETAG